MLFIEVYKSISVYVQQSHVLFSRQSVFRQTQPSSQLWLMTLMWCRLKHVIRETNTFNQVTLLQTLPCMVHSERSLRLAIFAILRLARHTPLKRADKTVLEPKLKVRVNVHLD